MTNQTHPQEVPELVERLRALLAKATPGPWAYDTSEPDPMFTPNWSIYPVADDEYSIAEVNGQVKKSAAEAELIVEAVNALPTLLTALELQSPSPGGEGPAAAMPGPIDMLLYCPMCGIQHVDEEEHVLVWTGGSAPEPSHDEVTWDNPPHRSHLCHACGCIWRPADVPTNGVVRIATVGKADTWGESNSAALALTPSHSGETGEVERWRHVKRGTVYEVIGRGELQMSFDALADGSSMVVYRGEDGKIWVREESEFEDGRFERLKTSPDDGGLS